ncbi:hypothetical protein GCM10010507_10960 [Streptomyces cinnamoneus]|uniref:Uncharacterized protein n=1 Tax=Streptomyces cinnamoneus TaxID=53446 RepID=A0A918TBE3_STRCJ|nr:hypothetical protein GCM10010507_10960 [Streptomyces cinnamoneus]
MSPPVARNVAEQGGEAVRADAGVRNAYTSHPGIGAVSWIRHGWSVWTAWANLTAGNG